MRYNCIQLLFKRIGNGKQYFALGVKLKEKLPEPEY